MSILYLSALSSPNLVDELYNYNKKDPGFAVQKFNRLLASGLVKNEAEVTVLSAPPVGRHNSSRLFWHRGQELEGDITYRYLTFINLPGLRQLCLTLGTFCRTLFWTISKSQKERAVVCDVLNASMGAAAILACKITGAQTIGVMTDMPGLMVRFEKNQRMPLATRMATSLIRWCFRNYDKFVFLTEAMNVVNQHHRPYIVMEGMSDGTMAEHNKVLEHKEVRTIMYAGGLHERYGLKKLTEAFMMLPQENFRLKLFGSGPFVEELRERYCKEDNRVMYMGVVPNIEVVKAELDASLLVNPRPTHEEYTKYSFPSKNMEYMASGTPILTTRLSGMPAEYYPYIYSFDEETTEGYARIINNEYSICVFTHPASDVG